ncbi:MAG: hypothetical protein FJ288_08870 [Planctomycetes bacterium]|nr:hypothetical protein [Planctomycetota bacterium]
MPFTGKATYTAGTTLPEIAEDVSDLVSIISPFETPLLDALGDPQVEARSTHHEWLEDTLLPNTDVVQTTPENPETDTEIEVANPGRFRVGDQVRCEDSEELLLVTEIGEGAITVVREYGGTEAEPIAAGDALLILGNAALEGQDADAARFTVRSRRGNWTQIFSKTVMVAGSELAVRHLSVADELDFQKAKALRELLRDVENTVLNGAAADSDPQGSDAVRRTMAGIIPQLATNRFVPGAGGFPSGGDLDEPKLNAALRLIWERSSGQVDLIVVNGYQKRRISQFGAGSRAYSPADPRFTSQVSIYESDFGVQRVVLSRWAPRDAVVLLDSSRIQVPPLAGRSFHYRPLASTGDFERGQVLGEYTLELRNEAAHGIIRGLSTTS